MPASYLNLLLPLHGLIDTAAIDARFNLSTLLHAPRLSVLQEKSELVASPGTTEKPLNGSRYSLCYRDGNFLCNWTGHILKQSLRKQRRFSVCGVALSSNARNWEECVICDGKLVHNKR